MWHHYQLHSGFLTKVFCIMTCISTGAMVLLMTGQTRSCQLVSYMGTYFPHGGTNSLLTGLAANEGWEVALCDSLVFA